MDLIKASSLLQPWRITLSPLITITRIRNFSSPSSSSIQFFSSQFSTFPYNQIKPLVIPHAKKKNTDSEPVLESSIVQEVSSDEEEEEDDEFEYGRYNYSESLNYFPLKLSIEVLIFTDTEIDEDMDDVSDSDEDEDDEYFDEEEDSVLPYVSFSGNLIIIIVWLNEKYSILLKNVT